MSQPAADPTTRGASRAARPTSTARDSATVAGWTLVSRITGLLRVLAIGAVLGPTYFANTFQAGYVVPNLIYSLIAGQILAMVLVPGIVRTIGDHGIDRARQLLGRVAGVLLVISGALAALLVLAAPLVAWSLTFDIPDAELRARAQQLTVLIVLFVAPQVVLYTVAAWHTAAQHARGRFALAAAAPCTENLGVIATMTIAALAYGGGTEADSVPIGLVVLLGAGATASVAVHACLQVLGAARAGVLARPSLRWRSDQEAVDTLRRLRRSVRVAACPAAAIYLVLALAATVPGGVFVLQVAYAVHNAVIALSAHAVSTAVLPRLAEAARRHDPAPFAEHWRRGISYTAMASVPALVLLAAFARPAAELLTRGEVAAGPIVSSLAACLAVVAATQLAGGLHNLGRQALYARLDDRGPRLAAAIELLVTAAVGVLALLQLPTGLPLLVGLVVAVLCGEAAGAGIVLTRLRGTMRAGRFLPGRPLAGIAAAVAAMLPVVAVGAGVLPTSGTGSLAELGLLALFGTAALGCYASVLRALSTRGWG
ncbi:lipid II flippase MurJ [Haloechinothrix sp. LS1_15]|uniref:murein biosynthesis integral membrane protein MurJ n=1 Tax=Haloechinothrix sp. LS1_15 TaxID=2652248 RepID=UPI002947FD31|nr:lipid II flippase MurJ [Haloechinothrix sp. LS1_15]MDV6011228.1 hypothetical protein [Haloechinothrix sp. LS1_15]